jgi:hypothetical protein
MCSRRRLSRVVRRIKFPDDETHLFRAADAGTGWSAFDTVSQRPGVTLVFVQFVQPVSWIDMQCTVLKSTGCHSTSPF